jgi:hypothetical protein
MNYKDMTDEELLETYDMLKGEASFMAIDIRIELATRFKAKCEEVAKVREENIVLTIDRKSFIEDRASLRSQLADAQKENERLTKRTGWDTELDAIPDSPRID